MCSHFVSDLYCATMFLETWHDNNHNLSSKLHLYTNVNKAFTFFIAFRFNIYNKIKKS